MSTKPDFTIALPVYNGGSYLKECVSSILNQSYTNFILQIYNSYDNTDGSTEFVNSLRDERVVVIQADRKLTIEENWHRFLSGFETEYATIVGQDDLLGPDFLMAFSRSISQHPEASLWHAHYDFIDQDGRFLKSCKKLPASESYEEYVHNIFSMSQDTVGTGYVFRSRDYRSIGGIPLYQDLLFADFALWIRLTAMGKKINIQGPALFSFRIHNSTTTKANAFKYFRAFKSFLEFVGNEVREGRLKMTASVSKDINIFLVYYAELLSLKIIKSGLAAEKANNTPSVAEVLDWLIGFSQGISSPYRPVFTLKTKMALLVNRYDAFSSVYRLFKKIKN